MSGWRARFEAGLRRVGLDGFFSWWMDELARALPGVFGADGQSASHQLLLGKAGEQLVFYRAVGTVLQEVGREPLRSVNDAAQGKQVRDAIAALRQPGEALCWLLDEGQVLGRSLDLPLEAEENLRQVLEFEMDRYTPFKAEQVYFDFQLRRQEKRLAVRLLLTPRARLDEALQPLAEWGVQPDAVCAAGQDGAWLECNLLPENRRPKRKSTNQGRLHAALAGGAALLLLAVLALPVWQKRGAVLAVQAELSRLQPSLDRVAGLRTELDPLLADYRFVQDKKRVQAPLVAVLEDVAHILPDDTWLQLFDLKGDVLQIQGETASSSKLVGWFEQSRTLHDASFRAPLVKGQAPDSERFQLQLILRTTGQPEVKP